MYTCLTVRVPCRSLDQKSVKLTMPVPLMRESKSAATIRRRRRGQQVHIQHKTHNLDESWDSGEEDPELPLETSQVNVTDYSDV